MALCINHSYIYNANPIKTKSGTAYYYFIVTTERYSPTAVDFVVSGAGGHHSYASTICEGSWGNIIGTLSDTVKVAGEVHYAILDNYIRPD